MPDNYLSLKQDNNIKINIQYTFNQLKNGRFLKRNCTLNIEAFLGFAHIFMLNLKHFLTIKASLTRAYESNSAKHILYNGILRTFLILKTFEHF